MVLNPDDLLIFKAREEEPEKEVKKVKKPEAQTTPPPAPAAAPQPKPVQKIVTQQPIPEPPKPTEDYYVAPENTASSEDVVTATMELSMGKPKAKGKIEKPRRKEMDPRKLAAHLSCELHPWRRAYAICDYCKRAFCYEDIIESGGKYYCLDDIDRVPESVRRSQLVRYNNMSLFSSLLFMAVLGVFMYYSYNSVFLLLGSLQKLGLSLFINDLTTARLTLLGELALSILSVVSALLILMNARISFRFSALIGVLTVGLFSFEYLNQNLLFLAIIPSMSFVALIILAYSRVSYESLPEEEEGRVLEREQGLDVTRSSF